MSFKTMGEFREALAGLVSQAKRNKSRRGGKRPSRARRNMAIRYGDYVFDTPAELLEFKRLEQAERMPAAAEAVELYIPSPRDERRARRKGDGVELRGSLPTKAQARNIARAVGWWKGFCPQAAGTNMTPAEVLGGMGLTQARAQAVIEAFAAAGLPVSYTAPQQDAALAARARDILTRVGGVVCQAKPNGFNRQVNWTAYPQYAYDFYATPNGSRKKRKKARRNSAEAPAASFKADPIIDNAGPYTPHIYPYGVGGVPGSYAAKNGAVTARQRDRAARAGKTLSGGTSWPVHDRKHAILAVRYMAAGFGGGARAAYPQMVQKLAEIWPVEDDRNRDIWTEYRRQRDAIQKHAGRQLPTVAQLRGLA